MASFLEDIASSEVNSLMSLLSGSRPLRRDTSLDDFLGWLAGSRRSRAAPDFMSSGTRSYAVPTVPQAPQSIAPSMAPQAMGRIPQEAPQAPAVVHPTTGPLFDRSELVQYARGAAERVGLDPNIFERQINVESGFNPYAGSPAGAQGIAQIMPNFHPGVDTSDPYESLDYAAGLMMAHLLRYGGDYTLALAAYNAGPGAVDRYGGVPPFEETQRYIKLILGG